MTVKGRRAFLCKGITMGFSKPRTTPKPKLPSPVAIPEEGGEAGIGARRKRPRGRRETFLTGDLVPETGKKRFFG